MAKRIIELEINGQVIECSRLILHYPPATDREAWGGREHPRPLRGTFHPINPSIGLINFNIPAKPTKDQALGD